MNSFLHINNQKLDQFIALFLLIFIFPLVSTAQYYVSPLASTYLVSELNETSGLMNLDGEIWTHNDSGGEDEIYQIDASTGEIIRTVKINSANNNDWEDIAWSDTYVYIGDFGNNDGSRTNLRIYRFLRSELEESDEVDAEKIKFHFSDQISFEPNYHNTNFDCEALIHFQDNLYLFSKNWVDSKTKCYILDPTPGDHEATLIAEYNTNCLITGATLLPGSETLVLIGYNQSGGSFTWLFENYSDDDFFNGESSQLIWTVLSQIEGVCHKDPNSIYISSEEFAGVIEPTLYSLDLEDYITNVDERKNSEIIIYSQNSNIIVKSDSHLTIFGDLYVSDLNGRVLKTQSNLNQHIYTINMGNLRGIYLVSVMVNNKLTTRKVLIQ